MQRPQVVFILRSVWILEVGAAVTLSLIPVQCKPLQGAQSSYWAPTGFNCCVPLTLEAENIHTYTALLTTNVIQICRKPLSSLSGCSIIFAGNWTRLDKMDIRAHWFLIFKSDLDPNYWLKQSVNSVPFSAARFLARRQNAGFWHFQFSNFETRKCRPTCSTQSVVLTPNLTHVSLTWLTCPPQVYSCWWLAASSPGSSSSSLRLRTNDTRTHAGNRCSSPSPPSTCGGRTCR